MANSIATYTDEQIMRCLLTHNFTEIGRIFTDDVVTKIKTGAFYGATNLDEVHLPALREIGAYAFSDTSIGTLDLPWGQIESIGVDAFKSGFSGLPQNPVFSSLTMLGNSAFAGTSSAKNTQLRTISLPVWTGSQPNVTGITETSGIFAYCSALTSISAPLLTSIPPSFLAYCSALEEVVFPRVTSIGGNAFSSCSKLKKIDIGGAATSFSYGFLSGTYVLETFILRGVTTVPTISTNVFRNTRVASGYAYIYVPKSLEATFNVARNWTTYSDQIRASEDYPDVCGN